MAKLNISSIFHYLNPCLPGMLEEQLPNMSSKHHELLAALEFLGIEEHIQERPVLWVGRPPYTVISGARSFFAKHIMQMPFNNRLVQALKTDDNMRRICGWDQSFYDRKGRPYSSG